MPHDGTEHSCLHVAAQFGRLHLIRLLLSYGASPLLCNKKGNLPVHVACQQGFALATELLLYSQPALSIRNNNNQTPIDVAHARTPNNPDLNMILLDFYERESLLRRQTAKRNRLIRQEEQQQNCLTLPPLHNSVPHTSKVTAAATVVDFSQALETMQPPPSFATRKDKKSYANVEWDYRQSGVSHDGLSSLDDPLTGYVSRFLKAYAMVWPEQLFGGNARLPENVRQRVSEFVRHAANRLPSQNNVDADTNVWKQVRTKFINSHQRHPFATVEQATQYLKQLSQSAVKCAAFETKSTTCCSP